MGPQARQEYLAQMRDRYVRASRREKGRLLTEAVTVTGYHRKALIRAWRRPQARRARGPRRAHDPTHLASSDWPWHLQRTIGRDLNRDFHLGRPGRHRYTPNALPRGPDVFMAHSSGSRHRQRGSHCGCTCRKRPDSVTFVGHLSRVAPALRPDGLRPQSSVSPSAPAGPRSAVASPRTGVGSDDSRPAGASSTARVSPSARPS